MSQKKLNSMRLLEQHNIPYEVFEFSDTVHSAEEVAAIVGVPLQHVHKTLVVLPDDKTAKNRPLLVLVAAGRQLDLKKMAQAAGLKAVRMAPHKEAEQLTGLKTGGISPLALTAKNWPVFMDNYAAALSHIYLSAGQRGVNLRVPLADVVRVLGITLVDCSREGTD